MDFTQLLKVMSERGGSDLFVTAGAAPSIKVDGTIGSLVLCNEPTNRTMRRSEQNVEVFGKSCPQAHNLAHLNPGPE